MTVTLEHRADINLDSTYRVAWQGEDVALSEAALARIGECRESFLALVESDPSMFVYGVTTGFNQAAKTQLDDAGRTRQAQRKPFASAVLFGDPLPERVVRAIVLSKLTTFIEGHAAVTPELAQAVTAMLDGRALPEVPADNNDAGGQINMMTHAFHDLFRDYDLQPKESNALLNGTGSITAVLADTAIAVSRRLALAVKTFALSDRGVSVAARTLRRRPCPVVGRRARDRGSRDTKSLSCGGGCRSPDVSGAGQLPRDAACPGVCLPRRGRSGKSGRGGACGRRRQPDLPAA